jgi:hypothetical protein
MLVFLDFEASSLSKHSYPVEVAWVFEDGTSEAHLIRPAPNWTDWDRKAEAIHGIPREALVREGTPHDEVAARMVDALSGHRLFASAPSWDGKWLSALLRAAGFARHALRLESTEVAQRAAALAVLRAAGVPQDDLRDRAAAMIDHAASRPPGERPAHRALADAERERAIWLALSQAVAD